MENDVEVLSFLSSKEFEFDGDFSSLQSFVNEIEKTQKSVCFTGSRPGFLPWKYNESCDIFLDFFSKLKMIIKTLYKCGFRLFISGMALGFDTYAAEAVLQLRDEGLNISLECALPFEKQTNRWNSEQIKRYNNILSKAQKITYVSTDYDPGCFSRRNKYMVDSSSVCVAFPCRKDGGTIFTMEYAKRKNVPLVILKEI